jgi:hypothetical protein
LPPQSARSWSRNLMKDFHRGEEVCWRGTVQILVSCK